jgi:hypothetical protein
MKLPDLALSPDRRAEPVMRDRRHREDRACPLLPGPDGTEDLYGTRQTPTPDANWLQSWLTPIIGGQSAELATATAADVDVDVAPPQSAGGVGSG